MLNAEIAFLCDFIEYFILGLRSTQIIFHFAVNELEQFLTVLNSLITLEHAVPPLVIESTERNIGHISSPTLSVDQVEQPIANSE
ncbi:hypothetical protein SE91_28220 [Bradyrhizobium sp. DOA1]|nr:hypothetical protein SE91_28220 [Bradyrhizobium sp. DOA1]